MRPGALLDRCVLPAPRLELAGDSAASFSHVIQSRNAVGSFDGDLNLTTSTATLTNSTANVRVHRRLNLQLSSVAGRTRRLQRAAYAPRSRSTSTAGRCRRSANTYMHGTRASSVR